MKNITIAIIGCGSIANRAHLPALSKLQGVKIKYCIDLIEERAKQAQEKFLAEKYLIDYKQMLKDDEVQAVFVLTPNYSHYEIAIDCLKAKKHVFVEKPITVNYHLSQIMADEAKKNNCILNVGVCNRYNDTVNILKNMVERGEFGEIYHVYCSFRDFRKIPGLGGAFTTKSYSGGGVIIDWGVHFFDLIMYILGLPKIKSVTASCYSKLAKKIPDYVYTNMWAGPEIKDGINDVEEFASGFIRTEAASISFNGAWAQNIDKTEMFVDFLGDKAGARFDYNGKFTLYRSNNGILETIMPNYNISNMFEEEDKAFIESIISGNKSRSHIDNVLESAKLLDAIYTSSDKKTELNF